MSPRIDHLVIAVRDLDAAAKRYEAMGFTLTGRAHHPWGTDNRLVQLGDRSFLELLEVARPALIPPHAPDADPPAFSFGAFNRDFLTRAEGMSMLVLAGGDAVADVTRFQAAGLKTYAPFPFARKAPRPGGTVVDVAFDLAFATDPTAPDAMFFTCHNRFPENFWMPACQHHANGATGIGTVVMAAPTPATHADFLAGFAGVQGEMIDGGLSIPLGSHTLLVLTPAAIHTRWPSLATVPDDISPRFVAATILTPTGELLLDLSR